VSDLTKEEAQKRHDQYLRQLHEAAVSHILDTEDLRSAVQDKERAERRIVNATDRLDHTRRLLSESVEPRCGSATKPHRRLFKIDDKSDKVLVVNHDHGSVGVTVTVETLVTKPGVR
jgi:hypothetical protein